jgi:hypothetical protein
MCDISEEEQLEYLAWKEAERTRAIEVSLRARATGPTRGRLPVVPPEPVLA